MLVLRYPLRANLVAAAGDWPWGSLGRRQQHRGMDILAGRPIDRPPDWVQFVNEPQTQAELDALRQSINRGCPLGRG